MADNAQNFGSYIPSTNIWDPSEILQSELTSEDIRDLLVKMYQNLNLMAITQNTKDAGLYTTQEFVNGQIYFPNPALDSMSTTNPTARNVFRTVVNFGALPNAATKSVTHHIAPNSSYTFTRIYGTASDTTDLLYAPIPYASVSGTGTIELSVDVTNVNITTASNLSNYNVTYVILEYLKF